MLLQNTNTDFQFKEYPDIITHGKEKHGRTFTVETLLVVYACN